MGFMDKTTFNNEGQYFLAGFRSVVWELPEGHGSWPNLFNLVSINTKVFIHFSYPHVPHPMSMEIFHMLSLYKFILWVDRKGVALLIIPY
jgi:hypothetical protein